MHQVEWHIFGYLTGGHEDISERHYSRLSEPQMP